MVVPAQTPRPWRVLVPVVCLVAGVGFVASARDSQGTDLRAPGTSNLADTVRSAEARVHSADRSVRALQARVDAAGRHAVPGNSAVARSRARLNALLRPAGLTAVHGPGMVVVLDDADPDTLPADAGADVDPNQLVVHQSDLQAVVNALWAGGAEAMTIAGARVISTSAVRCVGNTLLLNGEVYSPPYRVAAIGPSTTMAQRLDTSPGVALFGEAAQYYGLGYTVESLDRIALPAYTGPTALTYATAGQ